MGIISATTPDWSRETPRGFWDPGRKLIKTLRDYARLTDRTGTLIVIRRKLIVLRHIFWSTITQCDIPLNCNISGGFLLPHPNGIVIHPASIIGPNCMMMHQTTLGTKSNNHDLPVIGGHVDIGPGAKILGGVILGDHCAVAANAVVLDNVNDGEIVGGIPARPIRNVQDKAPQ